jgi:hypothetical protein
MQALIRPTRQLGIVMHPTEMPRGTGTELGPFLKKRTDNADIDAEKHIDFPFHTGVKWDR